MSDSSWSTTIDVLRALVEDTQRQTQENAARIAVLAVRQNELEARVTALEGAPPEPPSGTREAWLWPFASDSPWNMPIGSDAQYSAADDPRVTTLPRAGEINAGRFSHPVYNVSIGDPVRQIIQRGEVIDDLRVPDDAEPAKGIPGGYSDRHMHVVINSGQRIYEMFGARRLSSGDIRVTTSYNTDLYGAGIADRRGQHHGTRAYGGSALGGLVRRWELEAGEIRHPLAMAISHDDLKQGPVWPATSEDRNAEEVYDGVIRMGTMYAIPPDVTLSPFSGGARMFAQALQDYGAYITDATDGSVFYAEPRCEGMRELQEAREQRRAMISLLRVVTNSAEDSVGGGGVPRVSLAPPLR